MSPGLPVCLCFLLVIGLCAGTAIAQDAPPPDPIPPAPADAPAPKRGTTAITSPKLEGKYATWTHHVGSAEESVVAVTVTVTDEHGQVVTRTGSGLVLRCDGFVLLPDSLAQDKDESFEAKISFVKMDGEDITAPFTPVGRPRFRYRTVPFVTLKINDHHFPCLPLLHPANVHPEESVRITWAVSDTDKPGGVKTFSRKGVVGERVGKENRYHLQLTDGDGANSPQPVLGATVTDDKGIAALGMIGQTTNSGAATGLTFTTFAHLDYICEEIGLCPTLADVPGKDSEQQAPDGMVRIPTGPIPVASGPMEDYYSHVYRTRVVCTPPFLIDKLPVTVGDYRSYLRHMKSPRLPQKWELDVPSELERDIRRDDLPITGAYYEDAVRYAEAQSKRLPTSVEWLEAAQGAKTDWLMEYETETGKIRKVIQEMFLRRAYYWDSETENTVRKQGGGKPIAVYLDTNLMRALNREQFAEQGKYFQLDHWPLVFNAPVGIRQDDVSAFGLHDVISNAPELTIKNYMRPFSGQAPKPWPADGDPYITTINYTAVGAVPGKPAHVPLAEGSRRVSEIDKNDPTQMDFAFGILALESGFTYATVPGGALEVRPLNYPGFRCAK